MDVLKTVLRIDYSSEKRRKKGRKNRKELSLVPHRMHTNWLVLCTFMFSESIQISNFLRLTNKLDRCIVTIEAYSFNQNWALRLEKLFMPVQKTKQLRSMYSLQIKLKVCASFLSCFYPISVVYLVTQVKSANFCDFCI